MNKRLQMLLISCNALGYLVFSFSRIFRDSLSDFARGFCDGSSIVCITIGTAYLVWCAVKRKNPYKVG